MNSRAQPDTLHRVLPGDRSWPLFDVAATRTLEAQALAAAAPQALMRQAGTAVARVLLATRPHARRVHAVAGPGHNGGDALVAAAWLCQRGLQVHASLLANVDRLPADARWALDHARDSGVAIGTGFDARADDDAAIDGLLGLGLGRAPEGEIALAIQGLNAGTAPVIAVDLPSGLDADRGRRVGAQAVRARDTIALLTLKPGLFTAQGRDHAGRIWLDTLGSAAPPSHWRLVGAASAAAASQAAQASHVSHKGSFGDLTVIGGADGMVGAVILAARAALSAGAGRVYLCGLSPMAPRVLAQDAEIMCRSWDDTRHPALLAAQTIVCGCGGGAMLEQLPPVLTHAERLVLDADALNAIAAEAGLALALKRRSARGLATLLTPHPLEAARLLGKSSAEVQSDRLASALSLAQRFQCTVLLKGSGSVIAAADGRLAVNPTGNARLASPGTGDVLAGWLGGAWSRAAAASVDPFELAAGVAWRHGRAAEIDARGALSPLPLRAGELIDLMRRVTLP